MNKPVKQFQLSKDDLIKLNLCSQNINSLRIRGGGRVLGKSLLNVEAGANNIRLSGDAADAFWELFGGLS